MRKDVSGIYLYFGRYMYMISHTVKNFAVF